LFGLSDEARLVERPTADKLAKDSNQVFSYKKISFSEKMKYPAQSHKSARIQIKNLANWDFFPNL
jgi:hypothetical protein